jgi:Na+:H+ antiporter, NhaA family
MSPTSKPPSSPFGTVLLPIQQFFRLQAAGGIVLMGSAAAALAWSNLYPRSYAAVLGYPITLGAGGSAVHFTVTQVVTEALMSVFFFVVGMEIKRELVLGELRQLSRAALPAVAAVGGVVVPAGIYLAFTWGTPGRTGWGIPMATDIAFCIGLLTLLAGRVPRALIVFVTALAIFDDIGGIIVIALFYGHGLRASWLAAAGGLTLVLLVMNRSYVRSALAYAAVGAGLWYAFHAGGVHATIAGVVLGLMIPARAKRPARSVIRDLADHTATLAKAPPDADIDRAQIATIADGLDELESPLERFIHALHPVVAFVVMPLFALTSAGVPVREFDVATITGPVALGAALGLAVGKPLGIFSFSMVAVRAGIAPMPGGVSATKLLGASIIAGIGFTVALFISALAFADAPALLEQAKVGVLLGSLLAGAVGFAVLRAAR